jgi:hypothetical protein
MVFVNVFANPDNRYFPDTGSLDGERRFPPDPSIRRDREKLPVFAG